MEKFESSGVYVRNVNRATAILTIKEPDKVDHAPEIVKNYHWLYDGKSVLLPKVGIVTHVRYFMASIQKQYGLDPMTAIEITNSMELPKRQRF